jgi:hypothetical protein
MTGLPVEQCTQKETVLIGSLGKGPQEHSKPAHEEIGYGHISLLIFTKHKEISDS